MDCRVIRKVLLGLSSGRKRALWVDFVPGILWHFTAYSLVSHRFILLFMSSVKEGTILEGHSRTTLIDPFLSSIYCYFNMDKIVLLMRANGFPEHQLRRWSLGNLIYLMNWFSAFWAPILFLTTYFKKKKFNSDIDEQKLYLQEVTV